MNLLRGNRMKNKSLKLAAILILLVSLLFITDIVLEKIADSRSKPEATENV